MDTEDLKKFLVVAKCNNLQSASTELNLTSGALSKIIKRIESKLNTQIFDRVGRNIVLNQQGEKFQQFALHLVHEAEQAISEFGGAKHKTTVKLSGPPLLLQHYFPKLASHFSNHEFDFNLNAVWEGEAINHLTTGQAHLSLITQFSLNESSYLHEFERIGLGKTVFRIVASPNHPLFQRYAKGEIKSNELSPYGFACPSVSPFCGIKRGIGSDGWRDDQLPRKIDYRCNDFSVLMSLVKDGLALAYVPDFILESNELHEVLISDFDHHYEEQIELAYKPSLASGWLNQFAKSI